VLVIGQFRFIRVKDILPLLQPSPPLQPELSVMIAYFLFFCQPEIQVAAISIPVSFYPHFGPNIKKLKNFTPATWRYRIGAWRFFYEIDEAEKVAFMIAASHRSSAYSS
jgi:mRNA-degrading endonuclease RelE of RelBE toxin-antitoxin system